MRRLTGITNIICPLIAMALWGSLFPCIKMGYSLFGIETDSVPQVLMFASLRFVVCGIIVCLVAYFSTSDIAKPKGQSVLSICLMGVFAIVLHYGFTYVALLKTAGSKTAILKQSAPLLFVCFSFLFTDSEKFSASKIIGALVGFCGIIAINGASKFGSFSSGDILVISASVCTVISMIISEKCARGTSPLWITGISQLFGGAFLLIISLKFGGKIPQVTPKALLVFAYICTASITGYTLFYRSQRTTELSKLFIIKFSEPLFACVFSALLIDEDIFKIQYLIAFVLISPGIVIGNAKNSKPKIA